MLRMTLRLPRPEPPPRASGAKARARLELPRLKSRSMRWRCAYRIYRAAAFDAASPALVASRCETTPTERLRRGQRMQLAMQKPEKRTRAR